MHPSSHYVRYLLAACYRDSNHQEDLTTVNETLGRMELPEMTQHQFDVVEFDPSPPQTFAFTNRRHKETSAFMKANKIYGMWHPNKEEKRVISELIPDLQTRDLIDLMLMGRVPVNVIVEHVNNKMLLQPPLTETMVTSYRHYFWNVDITGAREWNRLLRGDPRQDALMSSLYCGAEQALYRAGGNPALGDPKRPLREMYRQSYFRLQALRYRPDNKDTFESASRIGRDLKIMHDLLHAGGAGFEEQLKKFRQFVMKTMPTKLKAFDEFISSGSYSGDGTDNGNGAGDHDDEHADA